MHLVSVPLRQDYLHYRMIPWTEVVSAMNRLSAHFIFPKRLDTYPFEYQRAYDYCVCNRTSNSPIIDYRLGHRYTEGSYTYHPALALIHVRPVQLFIMVWDM